MTLTTVGERIADIRARLGAGPARPMTLRAFSAYLHDRTGLLIGHTELSRLERDARGIRLDIIEAIARVDPLQRGRDWLAWGDA